MRKTTSNLNHATFAAAIVCTAMSLDPSTVHAAGIVLAGPVNKGNGQQTYQVCRKAAGTDTINFKYDETHGPAPGTTETGKKASSPVPAGPAGTCVDVWVSKDTMIGNVMVAAAKPAPEQKEPGLERPGGFGTMEWNSPQLTLSGLLIDSSNFPNGPGAGTPDTLWGAQIVVSPLNQYSGWSYQGVPTFGARFDSPTNVSFSIVSGGQTVLQAELRSLSNQPGEINFGARLENVVISNTIGSTFLTNLQSAISIGRGLHFEVNPLQNLAEVTQGLAIDGTVASYYISGAVPVRAGLSIILPEPTAASLIFVAGLTSLIRERRCHQGL